MGSDPVLFFADLVLVYYEWQHINNHKKEHVTKAVLQRCSVKKVVLEISQNSQDNICTRASFLIKLTASGLQLY